MSQASDFKPFFDHTLIERAVQAWFVASGDFAQPPTQPLPGDGQAVIDAWNDRENWNPGAGITPIFTAYEALVWQKNRPRVGIDLNNVLPHERPQWIVDDRNIMRATLYRATLTFTVETSPDYFNHNQLRAYTAALATEIAPYVKDGTNETLGANALMTYHVINRVNDAGQDTAVAETEGAYSSRLVFPIIFSWRKDQLPGGINPNP